MYRNTYSEVNLNTLKNNVKNIIRKYHQYQYYIGVVKGNAYGHGAYSVKALLDGGVNYLAVSSLEEAIEVRQYAKEIPILCLEPISLKYLEEIIKYQVTLTVDSSLYAEELASHSFKKTVKVHLKLDTGMNRLGMKSKKEVMATLSALEKNPKILLEGIYTHLATSGISDPYFDKQVSRFEYLLSDIDLKQIPMIHIGRSLTLVNHLKLDFVNAIRLGIVMYGFNGSIPLRTGFKGYLAEYKRKLKIKKYHISPTMRTNDLAVIPAVRLYTEVMSLKKVRQGEFVGYGANYIAKEDMMVATLPIGYADGMDKQMQQVAIHGKRYDIIGDVCMDMTMVKVDLQVHLHDKVEIFGDTIKIREVALRLHQNAYHVFLRITTRVPRVYSDGTEIKY